MSRKVGERASTRSPFASAPLPGRSVSPASSSGEWLNSSSNRVDTFRVYRSRTGKFVVHTDRSPDFPMVDAEGKPAGWRGYLGIGNISYGSIPAESKIEVVETLEELRALIPQQLFDRIAGVAKQPAVEDLDI